MFGTLSIPESVEYLYTTFVRDYRGYYSQDQFTYREDPTRAIERSMINFANLALKAVRILADQAELDRARAAGTGPDVLDVVSPVLVGDAVTVDVAACRIVATDSLPMAIRHHVHNRRRFRHQLGAGDRRVVRGWPRRSAPASADYHSGDHGVLTHPKDPHLARQNPADYIGALGHAVTGALAQAAHDAGVCARSRDRDRRRHHRLDAAADRRAGRGRWRSIRDGKATSPRRRGSGRTTPRAEEAAAITAIAQQHAPQYLAPIGGTYSSEWWWSKIWKCLKVAPDVFDAAASWVELADFVPAVLAGVDDPQATSSAASAPPATRRCIPTRGAACRRRSFSRASIRSSPSCAIACTIARCRRARRPATCAASGRRRSDLREGIAIAMGGFDAHYGAVGSGIEVGTLVKIIGTSTCDCAIAPSGQRRDNIPGICGIVNGSIMPGYFGIEAGQSAVGDILNWWVEGVCEGGEAAASTELSREAAALKPGESGLLALDWNNGNRTILVDPRLTGLIVGQTLHTTRAEIYRALIEATAFGARAIIDRMREYGVPIDRVVCCGGIAEKNDLFMQIYADVIGQPMLIAGSPQAPALGAAISAAVTAGDAAGGYDSWTDAQRSMTSLKDTALRARSAGARRLQ